MRSPNSQHFTSDLKTLNGFPGQQSSFTLSSASDANKTSICSNCRGGRDVRQSDNQLINPPADGVYTGVSGMHTGARRRC